MRELACLLLPFTICNLFQSNLFQKGAMYVELGCDVSHYRPHCRLTGTLRRRGRSDEYCLDSFRRFPRFLLDQPYQRPSPGAAHID